MDGKFEKMKNFPYMMTAVLVVTNVLVFLVLSFQGMTEDSTFMLEHGAMFLPYVIEKGEYYRLFTSMFLHFGFDHLMSNMLMLIVMGYRLEPAVGRIRFMLLYLIAGLSGNIISAIQDFMTGDNHVAAGASGAVFGLLGGMFFVVLMNKTGRYLKKFGFMDLTGRDMIVLIGLGLYSGFTASGIDNAAHIGGLVSGFIIIAVLTIGQFRKKSNTFYEYYY